MSHDIRRSRKARKLDRFERRERQRERERWDSAFVAIFNAGRPLPVVRIVAMEATTTAA